MKIPRVVALTILYALGRTAAASQDPNAATVGPPSALGRIEGDLYVVSQGGEIKRGAANEVVLLRAPTDLVSRFTQVCLVQAEQSRREAEAEDRAYEQLRNRSAKMLALQERIDSIKARTRSNRAEHLALIKSGAAQIAATGMSAHYAFEDVAPGEYVLFATMALAAETHWWFVPVTMPPDGQVKRDLDNTNLYAQVWNCDTGLPEPLKLLGNPPTN